MSSVIGRRVIVLLVFLAQAPVVTNLLGQSSQTAAKFNPDQWPKKDVDRYLTLENERPAPQRATVSSKAMIAGTTNPFAIHAGFEVLKHGGSAVDAAIATSLAQIALNAGGEVSYAGIINATYYEAASGRVYTLNARYNTVQNEKDPLTIPERGQHSGRTALVPGFFAGVQALHDRFGKLPFADLFGPAIWVAEHGVSLSPAVGAWLRTQGNFVTRLPEGKRIFTKENGEVYKAGDLFRQPELAATLKKVASEGSAYIYKGEWARHFVDLVQREGGKMTLADLADYRALWSKPLEIDYREYHVVSLGLPNKGGLITLGSLKLAEAADLKKRGPYTTSPDTLYYLIQISRIENLFAWMPREALKRRFPDVDPSPGSQLTTETVARLLAHIQHDMTPVPTAKQADNNHSAGVLAVDGQGNVVSIIHSLNGFLWGSTGIFVDGISIPDSASFQQREIAEVGPGARLPDQSSPLIVLKGGKPVLASTAIGSGLVEATLQNLINVLDFGMNPKTSVEQPNSRGPFSGGGGNQDRGNEVVAAGEFSQAVLDGVRAKGQGIKVGAKYDQAGEWIGIQIDPETHKLIGGVTPLLPGLAEGY